MKFSEFKKYLIQNAASGLYLLEGDDAFFREKAVSMLAESAVSEFPELNYTRLENPSAIQLKESCSVLPFMGNKRAVLVKEYYPKAFESETLADFDFKNSACVLIVSNTGKSEITKKLSGLYTFVDCGREDVPVLEKWITSMFKAKGAKIEPFAAAMLAEYCNRDMSRIDAEIEKLAAAGEAVTQKTIKENVAQDTEYRVYMLANAAASKSGSAYGIIKDFALKGDNGYVQQLLIPLYYQFKRMFFVKDSKLSQNALSEKLGIKPYAVKMTEKADAAYSKKQLKQAMELCAQADYYIKSGKMSGENALSYVMANLLN